MDAVNRSSLLDAINRLYGERDLASELVEWFSVSGDMDDFIFYGDGQSCPVEDS